MPNSTTMVDEPVFTVDTLLKYMGNDNQGRAVVAKIVRDAVAPGMAPLALARAALEQGRHGDLGRIFHGLRGSIGTLGTGRFVSAASAIEAAIAEQRTHQLSALFELAEREYTLALVHAKAWLEKNDAPGRLD